LPCINLLTLAALLENYVSDPKFKYTPHSTACKNGWTHVIIAAVVGAVTFAIAIVEQLLSSPPQLAVS
jgi:hypothetical protein